MPSLLVDKIAKKDYKEVYTDLNSAYVEGSKCFVMDIGADGLKSKKDDTRFDACDIGAKSFIFDGDWKKQKLDCEDEYLKAFTEADEPLREDAVGPDCPGQEVAILRRRGRASRPAPTRCLFLILPAPLTLFQSVRPIHQLWVQLRSCLGRGTTDRRLPASRPCWMSVVRGMVGTTGFEPVASCV